MRKTNDTTIKQFENINATLEKQSKLIDELTKQVNFLMNNDRNAVMVYRDFSGLSMVYDVRARYIYNNKLCDCKLDTAMHGISYSIVENTEHYAIIESRSLGNMYYKLDKKNGVAIDITKEYKKTIEIPKTDCEKKELPCEVPFCYGDYVWCVYYGVGGWKIAKHKIVGFKVEDDGVHFIVNDTDFDYEKFTTIEVLGDKAFLDEKQAKSRAKELKTLGIKNDE